MGAGSAPCGLLILYDDDYKTNVGACGRGWGGEEGVCEVAGSIDCPVSPERWRI